MRDEKIISKLGLLTMIPLLVIFIGFAFFITRSSVVLINLSDIKKDTIKIVRISNLLNELQRERGISTGYISTKGKLFTDMLDTQRENTDEAFFLFLKSLDGNSNFYLKKRETLFAIRKAIDSKDISNSEVFDFYKKRVKGMLANYVSVIAKMENPVIKKKLQSYINLSIAKEALGQIRGVLTGMSYRGDIDIALLYRVIHARGIYDSAFLRFTSIASPEMVRKYREIIDSEEYKEMDRQIKLYLDKNMHKINIDPYVWWEMMSHILDQHNHLEKLYFESVDNTINESYNSMIVKILFNTFLFLLFTFFIIWLERRIKTSILRSISILNQYKYAVDRSSIVTKTDINGIITYANSKFCDISDYTLDELIGKPHNIIRHKDMPKDVFAQMWSHILDKKAWSGTIKNRRRDGSSYIVEATISPILDHLGEIEEFIAIRTDISENVKLRDEIENAQKDMIFKMSEVVEHRSAETGHHVRRVAEYSRLLAIYYGLSDKEVEQIALASPMHDIGKVGIPDNILNKPGQLTNNEWEIMKTHSNIGYNLFKGTDKPLLKIVAIIAYEHHEKYDGTGYPRGLKGDEIHIFGRITALADVYDAIGSVRCYKEAWSDEKIINHIQNESGKHFDPKLVEIFFKHIDEFKSIKDKFNS